jgi:hypothetical protein
MNVVQSNPDQDKDATGIIGATGGIGARAGIGGIGGMGGIGGTEVIGPPLCSRMNATADRFYLGRSLHQSNRDAETCMCTKRRLKCVLLAGY